MNDKINFQNYYPTDNSSKTNLHYDIIASKFMVGIENHQKKNARYNISIISVIFNIVGAVIQFGVLIVILIYRFLLKLFTKPM